MRIKAIHILMLLFIAGSCIDPYFPDIDDYLDLPVIEGAITSEPGPYTVKLSRSIALDGMDLKPISGAAVTISDDAGNQESLSETMPGTYMTDASGIRGIAGRNYRITVEIDGKTYQSVFETLQDPVQIDTIETRIENRPISSGYIEGLQFYVSTRRIPDQHNNLFWTLTETYKFKSELLLDYIYYGPDSVQTNYSDSGSVCWRTSRSHETFTYSAVNLTEPELKNFPLHYVNSLTNKLSVRYSVLVHQYTVSEPAYHFWNEVQKLQAESGSLYTRQPYQVEGNLKNTEDGDDVMLGYFMVAGVAMKRVFIDRPEFTFNYSLCTPDINLFQTVNPWELTYPLYAMELPTGDYAFAGIGCFDCRLNGGTETMPEFWKEY
jgi:hypothetical protein